MADLSPFARIRKARALVVAARVASDSIAVRGRVDHHARAFARDASRALSEALIELDDLAAELLRE